MTGHLTRRRFLSAVVGAAAVAVSAGALIYGAGVQSPPSHAPAPVALGLTASAQAIMRSEPVTLASDTATRKAEMLTLRVRNISCADVAVGSGFPIDSHTLITNRHVIAGAAALQMDEWDGTSIDGDVNTAQTGTLVDIGIVHVSATLPVRATFGPLPKVGAPVTAVGYPLGGSLTLSAGKVLGYVNASKLDPSIAFDGQAIEISASVYHGNSGGPLLDAQGRVVGIVYAGQPGASEQTAMRVGYAIPIGAFSRLLRTGGTTAVSACG